MVYYDEIINTLVGMYHIIYAWTSIFCFIFNFVDLGEKGIMYVISIILPYFFGNSDVFIYKFNEEI